MPLPARSTWKSVERRVAAFFGSTRRALSGGNSKSGGRDDSMHDRLFIETKHRKHMPIIRLWRETRELAAAEGKVPVVALHEKSMQGFLLVLHADDFQEVFAEWWLHHVGKPCQTYPCDACGEMFEFKSDDQASGCGLCTQCWQEAEAEIKQFPPKKITPPKPKIRRKQ